MIAHVQGRVVAVRESALVVEVGGVGILVHCTPQTALAGRAGATVSLETTLVVREESLTLYGFPDPDHRDIFEAVQTVSGVGPRTALAVLATLNADEVRRAVARDDVTTLMRVPGIGRKGAERLVLELRDRLGPVAASAAGGSPDEDWRDPVRSGLESLGWSRREAESAVAAIAPIAAEQSPPDVAALLRAALQTLDRA